MKIPIHFFCGSSTQRVPIRRRVRYKQWLAEEAERLGIKPHALQARISRGKMPGLTIEREPGKRTWGTWVLVPTI